MEKIIVAAKSDNNVIGKNGDIPWHMPADLAFLERTITDGWLLTGRRSYESVQGDSVFQNGRKTVIITRQSDYQPRQCGAVIAHSLPEGIAIAEAAGAQKLYILGGSDIYKEALTIADRMLITEIHTFISNGDAFFPIVDQNKWREVSRERYEQDAENPHDYSFVVWERRI